MLQTYNDYWPLIPDVCPADIHFTDWLTANDIRNGAIFHFGTGGHHHVGITCAGDGSGNAVYGITASVSEHESYIRLITDQPAISKSYVTVFGDIYALNPAILPKFDVVTLFHLREFRTEKNDAYGALTDYDVTRALTRKTKPGGHILFYTGSAAYAQTLPDIATIEQTGALEEVENYKTLRVFRRTNVAL